MKNLLLAALIGFSAMGCKDRNTEDAQTLPPATQTGANTGGALVDGQVWVAKVENIGPYTGGLANLYQYVNSEYRVRIYLDGAKNGVLFIDLVQNQDFLPGTYNLNNESNGASFSKEVSQSTYYTDSVNSGVLTITKLDKINHFFSGTFSFKAKDQNGNVVNITDGRFDKHYTN